ncbi:phage tail fiber protein [Shimia sp.]|uniref:phage tail fiber domain-containing protein n=1 Tax=Shimia sp. TaxID=1954381 RepID=UPI003BAA58AD
MAKTIKTYVSDGSTTIYTFEFDYISKAFVKVLIDGVYSTDFTLSNTFQVTLGKAPAAGAVIVLKRETDQARLVEFVDGSVLIAKDLNVASLQALHIAAEAFDAASGSLLLDDSGAFSAGGRRITKVADPMDGGDVANKQWVEQSGTSFVTATTALKNAAETARTGADAAKARAVTAEGNAASSATASAQSASQAASSAASANAHKVAAETAQQGAASSLASVQQIETQIGDLRADGAAAVAECARLEGLAGGHESAAQASAVAAAQSALDAANAAGFDPASFAAAAHTHGWTEVTGKPSVFPPASHNHSWTSITGKPTTYPASSHSHDHIGGVHYTTFMRKDELSHTKGLVSIGRNSSEQLRLGYNAGASLSPYVGFYRGGTTRVGYIQGLSDRLRISRDGGGRLDLFGSGDARINDKRVFHEGHKPNWNGEIANRPNFSISTGNPSGGKDGDFWFKV